MPQRGKHSPTAKGGGARDPLKNLPVALGGSRPVRFPRRATLFRSPFREERYFSSQSRRWAAVTAVATTAVMGVLELTGIRSGGATVAAEEAVAVAEKRPMQR